MEAQNIDERNDLFLPNPKSNENPKLLPPLLENFLDKFPYRFLIHSLGAVNEWITILISLRSTVAGWHFVFRDVDAQ